MIQMITNSQWKKRFLSFLNPLKLGKIKTKTHDLRQLTSGVDYCIDFLETYSSAQMTTAINVKVGEQIIVSKGELTLTYLVEAVDYYWNDDTMRRVQLKRIQNQNLDFSE